MNPTQNTDPAKSQMLASIQKDGWMINRINADGMICVRGTTQIRVKIEEITEEEERWTA